MPPPWHTDLTLHLFQWQNLTKKDYFFSPSQGRTYPGEQPQRQREKQVE